MTKVFGQNTVKSKIRVTSIAVNACEEYFSIVDVVCRGNDKMRRSNLSRQVSQQLGCFYD